MQIKQLKSMLAGHYFSPWDDDDLDVQKFLAPLQKVPPKQTLQAQKNQKNISLKDQSRSKQTQLQDQARKILLDIQYEAKKNKMGQYRFNNRKNNKKIHNISNRDNSQLKLPPINTPYDFGDSFMLPKDHRKNSLSQMDSFRKIGQFKKVNPKIMPQSLQKSISYDESSRLRKLQSIELRKKSQTIQVKPSVDSESLSQIKGFKLRGNHYSLQSKNKSDRKLTIDRLDYIPSQPNITPNYLFFGQNKDDILKKVSKQLGFILKS